MKLEVQVISEERIKPSSPTPEHLRHYQLSFLDQLSPPVYMPVVLFFPTEPDNNSNNLLTRDQRLNQVKKSLSEALSLYYPLAGVVKEEELCVDCNDDGAYFVLAQANCNLSSLLDDPNPNDMNELIAVAIDDDRVAELPVGVKVTFFDCDGMTVSLCLNHKVGDALSFFMFLTAWAALSRGETDITPPQFGVGKLFPAKELADFTAKHGIMKHDIVTKRFVFDASEIAELRVKYEDKTNIEYQRRPTRVEALSAFIWSRLVAVTHPKGGDNGGDNNAIYTVLHAVNLRTRTDPPLPNSYFGNLNRIAVSAPPLEPENGSYKIVTHVRDSIKRIDPEFVKKLQQEDHGHLSFLKQRLAQVKKGEVVSFSFTSLCRFPIYEADFGWGKPAFVGSARLSYKNLVCFFDTKSGDGIEAWVNLRTEDMAKFEADEEILAYVSPKSKRVNYSKSV
ncbi:hypothetical protein TIFTF001_018266 [Ficus carica]|uniref:Uncharacterized protein n=1 Tax=Ficus carica TaxID=3494 RepID=A0AA88A9G6_FICCA|nr:hypothetical protein TIFTF001_018266 [Ficus carica]